VPYAVYVLTKQLPPVCSVVSAMLTSFVNKRIIIAVRILM